MSLDLVLSCWRHGQMHRLPTTQLSAPFQPLVLRRAPRCLVLGLADGQESLLFGDHAADNGHGLTLSRPVDDPALWQAVFEALQCVGTVLLVPGPVPPLVGQADTLPQLPADMVDSLGAPALAASPADIRRWVVAGAG